VVRVLHVGLAGHVLAVGVGRGGGVESNIHRGRLRLVAVHSARSGHVWIHLRILSLLVEYVLGGVADLIESRPVCEADVLYWQPVMVETLLDLK